MTIRWPRAVLRPQNASFDIAPRSLAAPSSVSGVGQVVSSDAGIWKATFSNVVIRDRQHVLAFRAIANLLEGRLGSILVPFCRGYQPVPGDADGLYEPVPHSDDAFFDDDTGYVGRVIDVKTVGSMALRAVSGTVSVNYAGQIEPGQHFSVGERLYRVRSYQEIAPATPAGTVTADAPFTGSSFTAVTPNVSRASRASYFDSSGVLRWAEPNELRLDHDPVTGAPRGALIEGAATNIFTNAGGLAAYLTKIGTATAVTEPSIVGPDGKTGAVAQVIAPDFNNRVERYFGSVAASSAEIWSSSIFVRAVSGSVNGTLSATDGGSPNTGFTAFTVGTEWQRVTVSQLGVAGTNLNRLWRITSLSGPAYIWGPQLEKGLPTSYIKTEGAQVTRAADNVSVPTSAFPFNNGEWTLLVECIVPMAGVPADMASFYNSADKFNEYTRLTRASGGTVQAHVEAAGVLVARGGGTVVPGSIIKASMAVSSGSTKLALNGVLSSDLASVMPNGLNTLLIGDFSASPWGHIKRLIYFPRRLSNDELQRMTSAPSLLNDPLTANNLVMIANESTTIHADNNNHWLVRLNDGTELTYSYVEGPLSIPVEDLGYHTIESYRTTLAKPLPATAAITFRPPLREGVPAGTNLEFDDPVVRMRLATDSEMDLPLDLGRFSFPTVNFVEDL